MSENQYIWTLAEINEQKLNPVSFELLARAAGLREKLFEAKIVAILLGEPIPESEVRKLIEYGADEVIYYCDKRLKYGLIENNAALLYDLVQDKKPSIFLAGATTYGRTLMPYLAIKLNTGLTADCTLLDIEEKTDNLLQTRPAIGGNILATIKTPSARPQMATVRPFSSRMLAPDRNRHGIIQEKKPAEKYFKSKVKFLRLEKNSSESVSISEARKIVCGGRGFGKSESFKMIHQLAELLEAGVGASREAVDRGWIPYPHQIGLSGKTVNPELYIGAGVSGTIQHLAGMQTSKHIIAINRDPEAQIFKVANLSIIGNLFEILPILIQKIKDKKGSRL